MRIWASAIIGTAVDKITGNKTNTGAQAAIDGTKYNDLREAEIIAAILAAQNANKEVIKTATENVNKGGGKQNEEIVEKVTEGKEETAQPKEPTNNGYQDQQSQEMKPEPPKTPGQIEGNIIKENNEYYEIQGGEKVKVPAEEVEGNKRYYVEGQGWYEIKNGVDTYVETDRVIDGKHWTIDEQGKDKYVGEVSEGFNKLSKEEQEIALKYNSATAIADKIEYVGRFLGESWKGRIEVYWENQYELFIMSGTTPELAKAGADIATGELLGPVMGGISNGKVVASDLGILEKNIAKGSSKAEVPQKVIGHYPEYVEMSNKLGTKPFSIPDNVWNKMTELEQWAANQKFLDRAIEKGAEFNLATPLDKVRPGSYLQKEIEYLTSKGYKFNEDGTKLIK